MLRMMNRRPLVWFAASWVAGSAAAAGLGLRGALLAAGAALLLAAASLAGRLATATLAALCLLAFCLAAGQRLWADERNATSLVPLLAAAEASGPGAAFGAEASGTIVSAVEVDGDRAMFRMKADAVHAGGAAQPLKGGGELLLVQLRLATQPEQDIAAAWQRGDRVAVAGELARPATATNSGGFDYRRYLGSQRIHWLLKAKGAAAVTAAPAAGPNAAVLLGRVDAARELLGARFGELYPSHQSGYMQGLILGLRTSLDPEQFDQFARLGLTHILAISGLHVAVYMVMMGGLLRICRMSRERIQLSLMITIPLYVLLTGASPSVLRAGIMAILGLIAARLGKLKDGLHLLAAAAVAILAYDPYYLDSVSFQLSFVVTLGLICGVPPLRRLMPRRQGVAGWLCDLAAVTIAAQLVSFPLTIYYFNGFHLLSLAANFVLVPFISFVIMPIGTIALLLSPVWMGGAKMLAGLSVTLNDWTFWIVDMMADVSSMRLIWETPSLWWVASYMLLLFLLFRYLRQLAPLHGEQLSRENTDSGGFEITEPLPMHSNVIQPAGAKKSILSLMKVNLKWLPGHRALLGLTTGLIALIFYAYYPNLLDRSAVVSFLDVGQGDSALIRTPGGKHILIDGGGTMTYRKPGEEWRERSDPFEVGKKVVLPLLMKRGVKELDVLVISHLDSDHIRGLKAVVQGIPVRAVWWNGTMKASEDVEELMSLIVEAGIPLYAPRSGNYAKIDGETKIQILWPPESDETGIQSASEQNESSLVMTLEIYGHRFLFAGDVGMETERAIIALHTRAEDANGESGRKNHTAPVDIMKLNHHGSRHSTGEAWLAYWAPRGAVASVGASNTYGHPHPDVLGRVQRAGARLWRTDTDGESMFRLTPQVLSYRSR
jgi:competence protein ComEC